MENSNYHDKLEFDGIEKNPIYGYAYVQVFLDNEKGTPGIQPDQCRLVTKELRDIEFTQPALQIKYLNA